MTDGTRAPRRAFSLIELVIVVVIIAIIGAIAIPRLSRGAEGASDAALIGDLAVLRTAIDLYSTEHVGLAPTLGAIGAELMTYSDVQGNTNATKTTVFIYGPYLRNFPPCPVGPERGQTGITGAAGTAGFGWVYDAALGTMVVNTTTETDDSGKLYNTY